MYYDIFRDYCKELSDYSADVVANFINFLLAHTDFPEDREIALYAVKYELERGHFNETQATGHSILQKNS